MDTTKVKGYNVYRQHVDSSEVKMNIQLLADTFYVDSTGIQDETYIYRVASMGKDDVEGVKTSGDSVVVVSGFELVAIYGNGSGIDDGYFISLQGIDIDRQGNGEEEVKYVLIILVTIIAIWPVYWLILGSFQNFGGVFTFASTLIPKNMHLKNYQGVLSSGYTLRWIWNSARTIVCQCALTLAIVAPAGMAFALYDFKGKQIIFWAFLAMVMLPGSPLLIGKLLMARRLGLTGTWLAGFVPVLFYPVGIFLFRNFVEEIPKSILDSARVDGAGEIRILARIILPLCLPAIGVILLFTALAALNNYLWQSIVLQKMELKTLLVGMVTQINNTNIIYQQDVDPLGLRMAAGCILLVPQLAIFITFNKKLIKDLRLGALTK